MRRLILQMAITAMFQNIVFTEYLSAQTFVSPVDFQIFLSGSFAELRSGHFHSGIDIKTQGVIGKPIRSIDDGYVSRIKVQTNGYGKSVYINHPGGYTSVYGHLSEYESPVREYVKKHQYRNRIHGLDIYPAKNELVIKKGEIIAYSGNTGSSSGPHLHFEVRNAANQHPLNPQKFSFNIHDNVDPRIFNFYVYSFKGKGERRTVRSRKKTGLFLDGKTYRLKTTDTLIVDSPVSFGMEVYDFLNGVNNRCGIHFIKMFVDDELIYHFQADEFSFAETRYINAHTDYYLKQKEKERVHQLFRKPNNPLSMYPYMKNEGITDILPGQTKKVKIVFSDIQGNSRSLNFLIRGNTVKNEPTPDKNEPKNVFHWDRPNSFENHLIKLELPSGSLYEDAEFNYLRIPSENTPHPWIHITGDENIPLHKSGKLMVKAEGIPPSLLDKACIVKYHANGTPSYQGGEIQNDDWLMIKTREFGRYGILTDTIAPKIIPINFSKNSDMRGKKNIRFIIRDNLSEIGSYRGFIDNTWVLFEYDPKNELLFHTFDPDVIEKGANHEIEIYVEDKRGNKAMFHSGFFW